MLQIFEKIKPLDSAPISLSVTTAALSSTRAGRLCGLYTLHLYFYVFAEAVAVAIIDCYPTTASSVLLLSKQALQHCVNSRARQVFDELAASSQAFRRRRASRPRRRELSPTAHRRPLCHSRRSHPTPLQPSAQQQPQQSVCGALRSTPSA